MSDFEGRLVASMRYGAEQARPGGDPMTVIHDRADQRRHRGQVAVLAGLMSLFAIALPGVLFAASRTATPEPAISRPAPFAGPAGGVVDPAATGVRAGPVWQLVAGLFHDHGGAHPVRALEVTVQAGGYAFLIVVVEPRHPGGKTYLQQLTASGWVKLGPHELDVHSRVAYLLRPPAGLADVTYRVFVPAAAGQREAYSVPVTVHVQH
jgi:hypothetical protein